MVMPFLTVAAPTIAKTGMEVLSSAIGGAKGQIGSSTALAGGTQGTGDEILRIQKQYGVSPEQASALASEIQERERNAQSKQSQNTIYENAALQNKFSNLDVQRGAMLNAQQQQANLAGQLVNSVQSARDAASNAVMSGANAVSNMSRGAIR
jgi:hypothetical protein